MNSTASERDFVALLSEQGYSAEGAREELVSMGWHPQSANLAVQRFALGAVTDEAVVVPGPNLGQLPTRIDAGDREVRVLASMRLPRMCLLGDFLSAQECAELIAFSTPRMQRSKVLLGDGSANEDGVVAYARTSDQTYIAHGESELVDALWRRAARFAHWPEAQMDDLQVVRYRQGADFSPHHDYLCPKVQADLIASTGQRLGTLLMYLNTPPHGGATALLDVEMEIYPQQGNALFFSYPRPSEDSLTLHAGVPLGEGEKWIATFFLTDRVAEKNEKLMDKQGV